MFIWKEVVSYVAQQEYECSVTFISLDNSIKKKFFSSYHYIFMLYIELGNSDWMKIMIKIYVSNNCKTRKKMLYKYILFSHKTLYSFNSNILLTS